MNLFASPTKPRPSMPNSGKQHRARHSHGDYSVPPQRESLLAQPSNSKSIPDLTKLARASRPSSALIPPVPGLGAATSSSPDLLSPNYVPNHRTSSPTPARQSSASTTSDLSISTKTSAPHSSASTPTSLVQSPFADSPGFSSTHMIYAAPDELYHQVRRPAPRRDFNKSTAARPSNSSLRTTTSLDSNSTVRESTLGVRVQTPTPATYMYNGGTIRIPPVMPGFDQLGPMFDRQQSPVHIVAGPAETTWVGLYIPSDHAYGSPNDDPRFVMYGKSLTELIPFNGKYTPDMSRLAFTSKRHADGSARWTSKKEMREKALAWQQQQKAKLQQQQQRASVATTADTLAPTDRSNSSLTVSDAGAGAPSTPSPIPSSDTLHTDVTTPFTPFDKPAILAATMERWIGQLTSQLDYEELLKFFYTYRSYITPFDLLHILIYRFQWTLTPSSDTTMSPPGVELERELASWAQDGAIKKIVRARTCVVIRYWLSTFFVVDFQNNRKLALTMTNWLNVVHRSRLLDDLPDAKVRSCCQKRFFVIELVLTTARI